MFDRFLEAGIGPEPDIEQAMAIALGALTLLGLGIFGPSIANGIVAGGPQLGAGAAAGTTVAAGASFRIAWTERRYQDGSLIETSRWSAILTVTHVPPRTPDALRRNPLGVFVSAISWSKELSQ